MDVPLHPERHFVSSGGRSLYLEYPRPFSCYFWDLESGKIASPDSKIYMALRSVSSDGQLFAFVNEPPGPQNVKLFGLDGKLRREFGDAGCGNVALSSNGQLIATNHNECDLDNGDCKLLVKIRDVITGSLVDEIHDGVGSEFRESLLLFSPSGTLFYSTLQGSIKIWHPDKRHGCIDTFDISHTWDGDLIPITFSRNGDILAACPKRGGLQLWNTRATACS